MKSPHILTPDLDRLEWEWVNQAELAERAHKRVADARLDLDIAEAKLDIIAAELSIKIRKRPKRYGLKSATEAAIKVAISLQPEYKKQLYLCMKRKHRVGVFQARATGAEHKKKGLEKLVDLWAMGYFNRPRTKNKQVADRMDRERKRQIRIGDDDD